jgi:V/A-type H+-transporting ATPase subunit D
MREITPTRSAYLELREEREGMEEGYRFLDEKRLVLAAEIIDELERYEAALGRFRVAYGQAVRSLHAAVARHGLGGVEVYPPARSPAAEPREERRSVLGLALTEVRLDAGPLAADGEAPAPSPEADRCRELFARLLPMTVSLAAMVGNLERLRAEYERTSRRARALEDVLLPELDEALARVDTALEELDKEEAVRVRYSRPGGGIA